MIMDFESWHCEHEQPEGPRLFCPIEGCPKSYGCARDHGWKPGQETPRECQGLCPLPTPEAK